METREELINNGLGFLGRSEIRKKVYEKINGHKSSAIIAKELKLSQNQILNDVKKLKDFGLIIEKNKIGNAIIYQKEPKYAHLNLHKRKSKAKVKNKPEKEEKFTPNSHKKPFKRLIYFENKYPEIFYNNLEKEINECYNNPRTPNAVLILSRKLIENILFNILEKKYPKKREFWWQEIPPRPLDFSILLNNLVANKGDFNSDEQELINHFNMLVKPFIKVANQTTHRILNYIEKMSEIKKYKIPEIIQSLIKLYHKL